MLIVRKMSHIQKRFHSDSASNTFTKNYFPFLVYLLLMINWIYQHIRSFFYKIIPVGTKIILAEVKIPRRSFEPIYSLYLFFFYIFYLIISPNVNFSDAHFSALIYRCLARLHLRFCFEFFKSASVLRLDHYFIDRKLHLQFNYKFNKFS